ncbi:hypothetical protein HO173_006735 [Letharia columbiana]|uniref:BTB domain-containing protein n=1 Tax=Letharia columbiana TaxID=112416 RepID=A0A8H6FUV0_9LECA|nr:uncharacterized protein HO173_006735 [Letharia columbiana]KAF6235108.1 hypothetical protein HO173_006735 [Letharia columbiana]
MADIHKDRLLASNELLWTSQKYSDMTIRCGSKEYKVHRSVICPRSTFFAAACNGEFMEAKSATITMNDDDLQAVENMLLYLYTLDYPDEEVPNVPADHGAMDSSLPPHLRTISTTTEEDTNVGTTLGLIEGTTLHDPRMMNHALVYAVADKYDIPELKELAKCKFQTLARSKWPHDDLHAVTEIVFSTTPDQDMGLRQIILDICAEHFQDILKDEGSRDAVLNTKAITVAVLDAAVRKYDQDTVLLDGFLAKQIELECELLEAKKDAQVALDQKDAWASRLDSLLQRANNIQKCRHCQEQFQWTLERSGSFGGLGMLLRCASCRTKEVL